MNKVIRIKDGRAYEEVNEGLHQAIAVLLAFAGQYPNSEWYIRDGNGNITCLRLNATGSLVLIEGLKVPLNDLIDITHASGVYGVKHPGGNIEPRRAQG